MSDHLVLGRLHRTFREWSERTMTRRIVAAMGIMSIVTLVVKAASFLKDVVVAARFGLSPDLDSFFLAFAVANFVVNGCFAAYQYAFLPEFVRAKKEGVEHAQRFLGASLSFVLRLSTGVALLGALLFSYAYQGSEARAAQDLTYVVLVPFVVFASLGFIAHAVLQSEKQFLGAGLVPILNPLVVLLFLVAAPSPVEPVILAIGISAGSLLELVALSFLVRGRGFAMSASFGAFDGRLRSTAVTAGTLVAATLVSSAIDLVDQSTAATLELGAVSALNFGTKVPQLLVTVVSFGLAQVTLPYFAEMITGGKARSCARLVARLSVMLFVATAAASAIGYLFSEEIVRLLFERKRFDRESTLVVASIQRAALFSVPPCLCGILLTRYLIAAGRARLFTALAVVNLGAKVVLNAVFTARWGVQGIAYATAAMYCLSWGILALAVVRVSRQLAGEEART